MEQLCYVVLSCLLAIVLLYGLLELHYFLRMCLCVLLARFIKRRCHILETTSVNGLCLSNDVDTLLYHMNNARYFRELDFARVDFYERTKLYSTIRRLGGSVFQGAATIRYRRFIRPFHRFTIESRIIYWDEQSLFMEHRFLRPADQFVHCIVICRQRVIDVPMDTVMAELLAKTPLQASRHTLSSTASLQPAGMGSATPMPQTAAEAGQAENGHVATAAGATAATAAYSIKVKPPLPPELCKWIEYNEMSSKNLRSGC
ncbi:protein THEM6 [Drosophila hydei]|uniref:Protein THEM6 n=1 Tax=Drosophila hydei TaxID=7224 RepID=A0A6J1LRZ0_DROHY|nr:protein THEM6 [Drosophila hydei]XP_023166503.1 protein THEM6 [Drosophila hydei]